MEIDQLTVASISLTFRTKTFLHESDDLVSSDTRYSSPRQRHRAGGALSCSISSTIEISFFYVVIAPFINIEYNLYAKEE